MTAIPAWMTTRIDQLIGRGDHYATRETLSPRLPQPHADGTRRSDLRAAVADLIEHLTVIITGTNPVWDGIDVAAPGRGLPVVAATEGGAGGRANGTGDGAPLNLTLMMFCPVCTAHIGAPCTTANGHVTRPHKARREQT